MTSSMHEESFGFHHRPFDMVPSEERFIPLEGACQVLDQLAECVDRGDGIALLSGPAGVGKTAVCHQLAARLASRFDVALLSSAGCPTRRSLLQSILFELGRDYSGLSEQEARLEIIEAARQAIPTRQGLAIIVDEAHRLAPRLLEELRTLTNHAEGGRPLIRVILVGTLQLEELLTLPQLDAMNQRIACHQALEPLTLRESAQYVAGRIQQAGKEVRDVLSPESLEMICHASDGNPRCLNQLCERVLERSAEAHECPVSEETVRQAFADLQHLPLHWNDLPDDMHTASSTEVIEVAQSHEDGFQQDAERESGEMTASDDDRSRSWSSPVATIEVGGDEVVPPESDNLDSETDHSEVDTRLVADEALQTPTAEADETTWQADDDRPTTPEDRHEEGLESEGREQRAESREQTFQEFVVDDRYAQLDRSIEQSFDDRSSAAPRPTGSRALLSSSYEDRSSLPSAFPESFEGDDSDSLTGSSAPFSTDVVPDEMIERVMAALNTLTGREDVSTNLPPPERTLDGHARGEASWGEPDWMGNVSERHADQDPPTPCEAWEPVGAETGDADSVAPAGTECGSDTDDRFASNVSDEWDVIEPEVSPPQVPLPGDATPHSPSGGDEPIGEPPIPVDSGSERGSTPGERPYVRLFSRLRTMRSQ